MTKELLDWETVPVGSFAWKEISLNEIEHDCSFKVISFGPNITTVGAVMRCELCLKTIMLMEKK